MKRTALAIAAHPDDIEFMMAGTLILLKQAGYDIHYMNVATGSCGTDKLSVEEIVAMREREAQAACALIGATFHPPLCHDIEIYYEAGILARLAAIFRDIQPNVILTQGYEEYMEDHSNTCRLAVSAAFCRGMNNFTTDPSRPITTQPVTIYHALPYGLRGPTNKPVQPDLVVNTASVIDLKREMLACHQSQKAWLDVSQGLDAYLDTLMTMSRSVGAMTDRFEHGEGWLRHLPLGFCPEEAHPLSELDTAQPTA